jgi:hypothetical protein
VTAARGGDAAVTVATWSVARRRIRHAGQRAANPDLASGRAKAKDTALTIAAMIPAGLFWSMVLAGSLHGLVAFGRDTRSSLPGCTCSVATCSYRWHST